MNPLSALDTLQYPVLTAAVLLKAVFVPFAVFYMGRPVSLDLLWAGLCLMGAVYFIFRS